MLAKVEGVNNAVFLVGDKIGTQMFYGHGAGGDATGRQWYLISSKLQGTW
jgi:homoserine dehydrogenase